ncbi:hypothetical protein [Azospirillum endophyticum]
MPVQHHSPAPPHAATPRGDRSHPSVEREAVEKQPFPMRSGFLYRSDGLERRIPTGTVVPPPGEVPSAGRWQPGKKRP